MSSFPLTNRIRIVNPASNLDLRYGPWSSINDALTGFDPSLRRLGLTVAISANNTVQEYWYQNGVANQDLVVKGSSLSSSNLMWIKDQLLVGTNAQSITSNLVVVKGGNIRVDGTDLSMLPLSTLSAADTDGQSLFDLRSSGPSANYNLSIASSGINHFMKFFGGREGDAKPFIVVKTGEPLRIASFSNFLNTNNDFTEHMRVDTATGNVGIGTQTPLARLTVSGTISGHNLTTSFGAGSATGDYSFAEGHLTQATGYGSHAEGRQTRATDYSSHAEGYATTASGSNSHAEGGMTIASGSNSHAEGASSDATGTTSHAEGNNTTASGNYSHSEGDTTTASGTGSHAEGSGAVASGSYSHVEGRLTIATGLASHAEGSGTTASGSQSHAEGAATVASGATSHAEGYATTASGVYSHAEGYLTDAEGTASHAEGQGTNAISSWSHAEGYNTTAYGSISHAQGRATNAIGSHSHAEGLFTSTAEQVPFSTHQYNGSVNVFTFTKEVSSKLNNVVAGNTLYGSATLLQFGPINFSFEVGDRDTTNGTISATGATGQLFPTPVQSGSGRILNFSNIGNSAHSEGYQTQAFGNESHAEGNSTIASGVASHAEGVETKASGEVSHAEGSYTTASGEGSHAEGIDTTASGNYSHAEGRNSEASGVASHAEGYGTKASGDYSHAAGSFTIASGLNSHAEGITTIASGDFSHASGATTKAFGLVSHAAGSKATAAHDYSYAWGSDSTLTNNVSTTRTGQFMVSAVGGSAFFGSVGIGTDNISNALTVNGNISANSLRTSFGSGSATGNFSFAEGLDTTASGSTSHAEGNSTTASGTSSHAEGSNTLASNLAAHAEGNGTVASGQNSHAEGRSTIAAGVRSHAAGSFTHAVHDRTWIWKGDTSTTHLSTTRSNQFMVSAAGGVFIPGNVGIGVDCFSPGLSSNALTVNGVISATGGTSTDWNSIFTHVRSNSAFWEESAEILPTVTNYLSTNNVLVNGLTVTGNISGNNLRTSFNQGSATGDYSFAVNYNALASGEKSHAEGNATVASGNSSHAEGTLTNASGESSHAEGSSTTASGTTSHAEGAGTVARGAISHAAGRYCEAAHDRSWIWKGSTVSNVLSTTRVDQFMVSAAGGAAFFGNVGIGTDSIDNALTINGTLSTNNTIYTNDKQVVTTNTTTVPGTSAVTGILAVSALPVVQETGILYILI